MKNLIRTLLAVYALSMPFHAHSMYNKAAKTFLTGAGTLFGAGVVIVPNWIMSGRYAYAHTQDAILEIKRGLPDKEIRRPTVEEDYFLRRNAGLKEDTQLYIAKDLGLGDNFGGSSFNGAIVIPERLPGFKKSLSQAINDRDDVYESCYIAIAQHEEGHNTELHTRKAIVFNTVLPTVEIVAAEKVVKKLAPYNPSASLGRHAARCATKMGRGYFLFFAHQKAFNTYRKYQELEADQHIKPEYRPSAAQTFVIMDQVTETMKQDSRIQEKAAWREWILDDHPSTEKRIAALGLIRDEPKQG